VFTNNSKFSDKHPYHLNNSLPSFQFLACILEFAMSLVWVYMKYTLIYQNICAVFLLKNHYSWSWLWRLYGSTFSHYGYILVAIALQGCCKGWFKIHWLQEDLNLNEILDREKYMDLVNFAASKGRKTNWFGNESAECFLSEIPGFSRNWLFQFMPSYMGCKQGQNYSPYMEKMESPVPNNSQKIWVLN